MKFFLFFFLFSSCARLGYMSEQAFGQLSLEYRGVSVKKVLADPKVSIDIKNKIRLVGKAKKFFYKYFNLKETPIYEQVTMLDQDAVTYLVIHSPMDEVRAIKTSLPFVGSFPYLGFFDEGDAQDFAKMKKRDGFSVYTRPVYAYSTLNHPWIPFYDNILSSFFRYKDEDLVSTIFHELVHTVVFIKDDIEFNENLAQFISDKLIEIYYKKSDQFLTLKEVEKKKQQELVNKVVTLAEELNQAYKQAPQKAPYEHILKNFLGNKFEPEIKQFCEENEILKRCWPLKGEWNNARLAALKTYEAKRNLMAETFSKQNIDLADFLNRIIKLKNKVSSGEDLIDKLLKKDNL